MLSKTQIKDINKDMLGLGRPDAADRQGYNKGDYSRMKDISMLITEYTDEEVYSSLRVMSKYKNTQLKKYAVDIDETLEKYEGILKEKYKTDDLDALLKIGFQHRMEYGSGHGQKHYTEAYEKLEMITVEETQDTVSVTLREKTNTEFFKGFDARRYNGVTEKGKHFDTIVITKPYLRLFVKDMTFMGRYGYKPDEKLQEILKQDILYKENYYAVSLENTGVIYDNLSLYIFYIDDKRFRTSVKKVEGVVETAMLDDNLFVLADRSCEPALKELCSIKYFAPKTNIDFSHINFGKTTEIMKFMCDYCKTNDPPVLTDTHQRNRYGYNLYKINIANHLFTKALWQMKGTGLMYVSVNEGNTFISSSPDMLPFLIETLNSWHIDITDGLMKKMEPLAIRFIGQNTKYHSLEYEINANNYGLVNALWASKGEAVKFVDGKRYEDKITVSTTEKMLPALIDVCRDLGIDATEIEQTLETGKINQDYLQE